MKSEAYQKVHELRASVHKTFKIIWDDADENAKFYRMEQYSDSQLSKMKSKNRIPYVLDYVTNPMNTYLGDQRDQRADIVYLPVEQNDEIRAELLNAVKDSTLRRNKFLFIESDVFQDGLIKKTGALGYEWSDERNPLGELRLFRIPPRQLTWDLNRRDFELSSARWVSRTRLYGRRQLIRKFPEFEKEIKGLSFDADDFTDLKLPTDYLKEVFDRELDAVALIELYERNYNTRFFILSEDEVSDVFFDTEKEATAYIQDQTQKYEQLVVPKFQNEGLPVPPMPKLEVKPHSVPVIQKTEVAQSIVFTETEDTDLPDFPYDLYHPYFDEGEYWAAMDLFKDPQRFANKMMSMIDHQISTGSKGLLLIDDTVPTVQANKIINEWSKTGGAFVMPNPKENVHFIPPTGFDPRLVSALEVAVSNIDKKAGGQNYLGRAEGGDESGSAIKQRVARGSAASFIIFDNFTRFKQSVGEKIAWYLTHYMSAPQKVRIEGEELTQLARTQFKEWFEEPANRDRKFGFLNINTTPNNTIENLKVDIIVDEAKHSVTKNRQVMEQFAILMQASPAFAATVPPDLLMELSDLPASQKIKYKSRMEQMLKAENARKEAEITKPPTLSAKLDDITLLDPEAQVQFAAKFGIRLIGPAHEDRAGETMLKGTIAAQQQEKDIAFKREKHVDQTTLKTLTSLAQIDLEHKKLEKENERTTVGGNKASE